VKGADGKVEFSDDDYRAVGEAMCLLRGKNDLSPKLLLRVGEILELDGVADINRKMGFGKSARNPVMGRYPKAVDKWLRHREQNPKMLEGLVKAGFRTTVMDLARKVGYKPESPKFFEILRWKQAQAKDGRREIAIGAEVKAAETWEGLSEKEICKKIAKDKPNYKRLVGLLPVSVGLTRAVMAAAMEAGCLSDTDIIILTPTIEDLGLLDVPEIKARWTKAIQAAENQRAANVARNVKKTETVEALKDAADSATAKAMEEVTKNLRVYVMVDISGSMQGAIEAAKRYLIKMLGGFPLDHLHVSVFNSVGREVLLKGTSSTAVTHAFQNFRAGGGTSYGQGVAALAHNKPKDDEDVLFIFIGDEGESRPDSLVQSVQRSGLNPVAFGLLKVPGEDYEVVQRAAAILNIPCFRIEEAMFNDPYSVTRTLRNLIANTPVTQRVTATMIQRKTLIQQILETPLLQVPVFVR
jgi:flavin-binding protein dodecin